MDETLPIVYCVWHEELEEYDECTYRLCGECGHVYQTPGDLLRIWRREADQYGWSWVRRWTRSANKIYFCPLCLHDF